MAVIDKQLLSQLCSEVEDCVVFTSPKGLTIDEIRLKRENCIEGVLTTRELDDAPRVIAAVDEACQLKPLYKTYKEEAG